MNNSIEKEAMTEAEKEKYIKATIVAGIGAAGFGAIVRSIRARKARAKAHDASKSKNAIIVPIKKTKFMEGLPTPEELAQSRGETPALPSALSEDKAEIPALPAPADASAPAAVELTPEEIAARKKEILRSNARRFDFFGKAANAGKDEEPAPEKKDDPMAEDENGEAGKAEAEDSVAGGQDAKKEERMLLRDQKGRFVSPTDPVAVAQEEKRANGPLAELLDIAAHPFDSAKMVGNAAIDKPVWFTAGALGSIYLAAKISDAINEKRREKAKERLENARSEYVGLLEGGEKTAQDDTIRTGAGMMIGGAFLIPMALSALVTNKIIENRKIDKKREKEMADSYPDDPIIMYKTSEAKEVRMTPDTAIAFMAVNREIMKCAELSSIEHGLGKEAQEADKRVVDAVTGIMADPANNADLLALTKAYYNNDEKAQAAALRRMATGYLASNPNAISVLPGFWKAYSDPKAMAALKSQVMTDPRTRATFVDRFNNDAEFGKLKNEILDKELANSWVGRTFKRDGALYRGINYGFKNFGIGNHMFNERLNGLFAAKPNNAQAAPAQPNQVRG